MDKYHIDAKGNLERQGAKPTKQKVHWCGTDMQVACFQEASPTRNVLQKGNKHERSLTSPDLEELSKDWTEHQEELAPHNAWTLHKELYNIKKKTFKDVQSSSFFRGSFPTKEDAHTSTAKPTIRSKDRMFSVHDGRKFLYFVGKKNIHHTQNYGETSSHPAKRRRFAARSSAPL